MDQETVTQMLSRDRAEWALLTAILDAHPDEVLHDPKSPPWTSRDIYAHLARWLNHSNKDMETYCTGGSDSPPVDNVDEVNAAWQEEDCELTQAEAREKAFEAFEKRLTVIASIQPDQWDKELERITRYDGAEHLAAHRGYICVK